MVDFTTLVGDSAVDAGRWVALAGEAVAGMAASSDSENVVPQAADAGQWVALVGEAAAV